MHKVIEAINKREWTATVLGVELKVTSPNAKTGYPIICEYRDLIKNLDGETNFDDKVVDVHVKCIEACTDLTALEAEELLKRANNECGDLLSKTRLALGMTSDKEEKKAESFLSQEQSEEASKT